MASAEYLPNPVPTFPEVYNLQRLFRVARFQGPISMQLQQPAPRLPQTDFIVQDKNCFHHAPVFIPPIQTRNIPN